MSYLEPLDGKFDKCQVLVRCDRCLTERRLLVISAKRSMKKHGQHVCQSCAAKATPKPQNRSDYWTEERRLSHASAIKTDLYLAGIASRDTRGSMNGMFGKQHSTATKAKMSIARMGKLGPSATAWKGGRLSVVRRVKKILHTRFKWYFRVLQRDGFRCVNCSTKRGKLDAHHIDPVAAIIKRLSAGRAFTSDEERIEWLVNQPELQDPGLKNGKTLCRKCHKAEHAKWGSHSPASIR